MFLFPVDCFCLFLAVATVRKGNEQTYRWTGAVSLAKVRETDSIGLVLDPNNEKKKILNNKLLRWLIHLLYYIYYSIVHRRVTYCRMPLIPPLSLTPNLSFFYPLSHTHNCGKCRVSNAPCACFWTVTGSTDKCNTSPLHLFRTYIFKKFVSVDHVYRNS